MRESVILKKLKNDEVATCFKTNFREPRIVDMIGYAGFDSVWTCMEHVGNDLRDIESQIYAAKSHGMDSVVRVPKGSYSDYIRPFEMDASAIMIPHLMSLEEAKQIVYYTKFHPIGRRPADGGNADGNFCAYSGVNYLETSNREKIVICQIEDPEPMEQIEEIAQLDGIDMLFFGPGDYSHSIGKFGQMNDKDVLEPWERMAAVCKKYGKFAGTVATPDNIEMLHSWGYRFLNMSSDVGGLLQYLAKMIKAFDKVR
ncbi:MAG: aldolase [Clostridia bacterium]|nr:aldolase [Clostridia bacterium]